MNILKLLAAVISIGIASALPQPQNENTPQSDVYYTTEVITQILSQYTTIIDTETTLLVQTAYVITDGFPAASTVTVTDVVIVQTQAVVAPKPSPNVVVVEEPVPQAVVTSAPSGPLTTLQPAVHWDLNTTDVANLVPSSSSQLYYSDTGEADPAVQHLFASLDSTYAYPVVVLEHSSFVQQVQCQPGGLAISFSNSAAFAAVQNSWQLSGGFVLVTHTSGCDVAANSGVRTFFLVNGVTFSVGTATAIVTATEIALQNAINEIDMVWGTYSPTGTSSGSSSPTGNPGCGAPPASTISGFPAAACGSDFDNTLDSEIGFISFDLESSLQEIAPGLDDNPDDYEDDDIIGENNTATERRRRSVDLNKRLSLSSFNPIPFFQKLGDKAYTEIKAAPADIRQFAGQVYDSGKSEIAKLVPDVIKNLWNPTIDTTVPINITPNTTVDSPFGPAFQLAYVTKSKDIGGDKKPQARAEATSHNITTSGVVEGSVGLYCVGCSVTGSVHLAGQVSFSILAGGITSGSVSVSGNLDAMASLGLTAGASYTQNFKVPIATFGIPGFFIEDVITVGPEIRLDGELDVTVDAMGTLLVGVEAKISNFAASLDLIDSSKSTSGGFTPVFTTTLDASGEISVSAGFGFPITLGVGIDLIPLGQKGKRLISVINKPSLVAKATYALSTTGGECDNGIEYSVKLTDDTSLDFFGLKDIDLFSFESPNLVTGCKPLGSSGTSGSSSTGDGSNTGGSSTTSGDGSNTGGSTTSGDGSNTGGSSTTSGDGSNTGGSTTSGDGSNTDGSSTTSGDGSNTDGSSTTTGDGSQKRTAQVDRRQDNTTDAAPSDASSSDASSSGASSSDASSSDSSLDTADGDEPLDDSPDDSDYTDDEAIASSEESATAAISSDEDGFTYSTIQDVSGKYLLGNDDDSGNFNLVDISNPDGSTTFAAYSNITVSDDSERIMHYYPDTMSKFGVSRFRMSTTDEFPSTADVITLAPLDFDDSTATPGVYVAVDSMGNFYYPVLCNLENQPSKIFLVADINTGPTTLANTDLEYIITGGAVSNCAYLALVSTGPQIS